jgi:hypothetical protein
VRNLSIKWDKKTNTLIEGLTNGDGKREEKRPGPSATPAPRDSGGGAAALPAGLREGSKGSDWLVEPVKPFFGAPGSDWPGPALQSAKIGA